MRKKHILGIIAVLVLLTAGAKIETVKDKLKDMKRGSVMTIENTDNGLIITITADNPEVVALLQKTWAERARQWNAVSARAAKREMKSEKKEAKEATKEKKKATEKSNKK